MFRRSAENEMSVTGRLTDREPPLGLILCESAGEEQVELLQLGESGIRVATYLTELPPKALLQKKLRAAAELARERLKEGRNE